MDVKPALELAPSLEATAREAKLDFRDPLKVGLIDKVADRDRPVKFLIPITDEDKAAIWEVKSLGELFRGDKQPPAQMDHYPKEYETVFWFIERHVLSWAELRKDPTDQELEEVYAALRRQPDGRSVGQLHDYVWQVTALMLGTYVLSRAEVEALFGALHRSAKSWAVRPISRNYMDYLRNATALGG
jgi:hypothetical protein